MNQKLYSRATFAELAGVSGAAVTKACAAALKPALDGHMIDANHPAARAYLKKHAPAPTPKRDELFDKAVEFCETSGKWTANAIKHGLMVGATRATKIMRQIHEAGKVPEQPGQKYEDDRKPPAKTPHVRGTAAKRAQAIAEDIGDLEPEPMIPEQISKYADMSLREIIEKFGTAPRFKDWLGAMKEIGVIEDRNLKIAETKGRLVSRDLVQRHIVGEIDAAHIKLLRDGSKTIAVRVAAMVGSGADQTDIERVVSDLISSFIKPMKIKVTRAIRQEISSEGASDE